MKPAMKTKANEILLTTEELAARWRVTEGHLRNMRSLGGGPTYVRVVKRGVRYRLRAIQDWELRK